MSFIRLTEQSSAPPQPATDETKKTLRLFAFDNAGATVVRAIDSSGNVFDFVGPQGPQGDTGPTGPQGPAGSAMKQAVADIDDPSSELASIGGVTGDLMVVYEDGDPAESTLYVFDSSVTAGNNSPYIVAGSGGKWIAAGGKYTNGSFSTSGAVVNGRDMAADGTKLDGIESGATADQTAGEIKTLYESNANTNPFTDAEQTKLTGIESGATADQSDAEIKTAYENNADTNAFTDAEQTKLSGIAAGAEVNPDVVPQAEAEAGTSTTERIWTAQRVAQAIAALAGSLDLSASSVKLFEDFIMGDDATDEMGALGWRTSKGGSGSLFETIAGEANHPGIFRLRTPSAASGRAGCALRKSLGHIDPGDDFVWESILRLNIDLTNQERVVAGLGTNYDSVGDQASGIYFEYVGGDTNWQIVANNAGTKTRNNTSFAVVNNNWVHLKITKTGSSIQANINGVDQGSAVTTNIPTAVLNPLFKIDSDATESGASDLDLDAFAFQALNLTRTT